MPMTKTQQEIIENRVCASVGSTLEELYGGWSWYVECRLDTGCVSVRNNSLNGDYGFVIPLQNLVNSTEGDRIIMQAGGEILERYRMDRSKRKEYDIKRDFAGNAVGDIT